MDLFFLTPDNAFYWDRAGTLESEQARTAGLNVRAIFRQRSFHNSSVYVFNRFVYSNFYRLTAYLCRLLKVQYLVDIDDLFWDLPSFSSDTAGCNRDYVEYLDKLITFAYAVTTTTEFLRKKIEQRYPGKRVFVVNNAPPAWLAPAGGVLIANTDSFKMGKDEIRWFIEVLDFLHEAGLGLQFIGDNQNLAALWGEFKYHQLPSMPLLDYLASLATYDFSMGLIPVAKSDYAECKSAIKLMEFAGQGIPIIASAIKPYKDFSSLYPELAITLVENNKEAWLKAVTQVLKLIPQDLLQKGKVINQTLYRQRHSQFQQWLKVAQGLKELQASPWRTCLLDLILRIYEKLRFLFSLLAGPLLWVQSLLKYLRK